MVTSLTVHQHYGNAEGTELSEGLCPSDLHCISKECRSPPQKGQVLHNLSTLTCFGLLVVFPVLF